MLKFLPKKKKPLCMCNNKLFVFSCSAIFLKNQTKKKEATSRLCSMDDMVEFGGIETNQSEIGERQNNWGIKTIMGNNDLLNRLIWVKC